MRIRAGTVTLATGIAVVLCVPPAVSVAASAGAEKLISRGRPVIASSERGPAWAAAEATDADPSSRWESAAGPGTQWLQIDLGAVRAVDRVRLRWDKAYAKAYRVQVSVDGANWTDVYATRSGNGGADDLERLGGSGRYVRGLAQNPCIDASAY
jgi:chitosanase